MVPVCCSWHTQAETTLAWLFAVSPNSLDAGAIIPGPTVTQGSEHRHCSEAGWSYNHHLPLGNSEIGFSLPFLAFAFVGCRTCALPSSGTQSLLHIYQAPLALYLLLQVALPYLHFTVREESITKGKAVKDTIHRINILGHF